MPHKMPTTFVKDELQIHIIFDWRWTIQYNDNINIIHARMPVHQQLNINQLCYSRCLCDFYIYLL